MKRGHLLKLLEINWGNLGTQTVEKAKKKDDACETTNNKKIKAQRSRWLGHVIRRPGNRVVKAAYMRE